VRLIRSLFVVAASLALGCVNVETDRWERTGNACEGETTPPAWPVRPPVSAGFDPARLDQLSERIEQGELGELHAVVVIHDGAIVFERYFEGLDSQWGSLPRRVAFGPETLHDQRSVTKSVVGTLVGIAHGDGLLPDLDAPIADLLPRRQIAEPLHDITLRHALTMSAGLRWDELSHPYWDPRNDESAMWRSEDPVGFVLSRPQVAPPGRRFAYNGGLPTVLAEIVESATGQSVGDFAEERLWCPLGISRAEWLRLDSGVFIAASGLRLRPRAMARFGWMMLEAGRFGGRQILTPGYVRASLSAQVDTGGSLAPRYGFQWWIAESPGAREVPMAIGNGGQRIALFPQDRMVVVVTAGAYDRADQGVGPAEAMRAVLAARDPSIDS
jgi:CubicO group peptidase (beta-lactamase class C family)